MKKKVILFFLLMKLAQSMNKQASRRLADPQLYFMLSEPHRHIRYQIFHSPVSICKKKDVDV